MLKGNTVGTPIIHNLNAALTAWDMITPALITQGYADHSALHKCNVSNAAPVGGVGRVNIYNNATASIARGKRYAIGCQLIVNDKPNVNTYGVELSGHFRMIVPGIAEIIPVIAKLDQAAVAAFEQRNFASHPACLATLSPPAPVGSDTLQRSVAWNTQAILGDDDNPSGWYFYGCMINDGGTGAATNVGVIEASLGYRFLDATDFKYFNPRFSQ